MHSNLWFRILLLWLTVTAMAAADDTPLRPEKAFQVSVETIDQQQLRLTWHVATGYYLYRDKLSFRLSGATDSTLTPAGLPHGENKHDDYFGDVEILRDEFDVQLNLAHSGPPPGKVTLEVGYQGCWDGGICYPPQTRQLTATLPSASPARSSPSGAGSLQNFLQGITGDFFGEAPLLKAEEAFRFQAELRDRQTLHAEWNIEDGYYLYRDKLRLEVTGGQAAVRLGKLELPPGELKDDPEFGQVQVFHQRVVADIPVQIGDSADHIELTAYYQGCAERGVCYPPMSSSITLETARVPAATGRILHDSGNASLPEQDRIAGNLQNQGFWLSILSFAGFGLLLAFTPCVFPMIPILSGIIVGQGSRINTRRAFLLSLAYVLASALVYTLFGLLAGLYGANLQAAFQHPLILGLFSLVFILLALSMFGFYDLQLPASLQTRLSRLGSDKAGSLAGAGIMGALSALIVGPCVAAPLAGALIFISQSGDALLGGAALFAMGMGMGLPLILIGTSAGRLLPAAGAWMESVKQFFGVTLLGVAIWLLARVLPGAITMLLSAALLIGYAMQLRATDPLPANASSWQRLSKGLGIMLLTWGMALLLGAASGNHNPLRPLHLPMANGSLPGNHTVPFRRIGSLAELEQQLQRAAEEQRTVMLDFYADWCISCIEMEQETFAAPQVWQKMDRLLLLQADVTANTADDKALLQRFGLVGPPAILFFDSSGRELRNLRVIGFQPPAVFAAHLDRLEQTE